MVALHYKLNQNTDYDRIQVSELGSGKSDSFVKTKRLPQAIIIGSRKSGTRALLQFLQLNPAIRSAKREVHFFDKSQNYKLGLDWYKDQMPLSLRNETTIEKTPVYFVTNGVPERVKSMNASIKLILIFRDPVIRLISDYSQLIANKIEASSVKNKDELSPAPMLEDEESYVKSDYYNGNNETTTFDEAEEIWRNGEASFVEYVKRSDGGIDDQRRAIRIGMYASYLEKWKTFFRKDQFHFVDGEKLILNPYEELSKLESFLNLKATIKPEDFVFNEKKGFYCINVTSSSTMRNEPASNKIKISCLSKNKGRRHVHVKAELIDDLRKFYTPYNEYLYSLTGQNFDWPN